MSLKRTFEYHIDADAWWAVPTQRRWRLADAFDWRHAPIIASTARRTTEYVLGSPDRAGIVPRDRIGDAENVTAPNWAAQNYYVGVVEAARPGPARCRHGRSLLGCLRGIGVQRDAYGHVIPPLHRGAPDKRTYPRAWHPPLLLKPNKCADCRTLTPDDYDTRFTVAGPNGTTILLDEEPPPLPTEDDMFRQVKIRANASQTSAVAREDDVDDFIVVES
jgi:hypothetical protein